MKLKIRILSYLSSFYWNRIYISFRNQYSIATTFYFNGKDIILYGDGGIILGENSYISDRSTIQASKGYTVSVGVGCHIASNVRIFTDSVQADSDFSIKPVPIKSGNVCISDFCWIGANVFINPGILIGSNSVVGANAVVTKNIPAGEIWGGVPARCIRKKIIREYNKL